MFTPTLWFGGPRNVGSRGHSVGSPINNKSTALQPVEDCGVEAEAIASESQAIIDRLHENDESALQFLVQRFSVPLTRFAYHYVGSRDTAEDIVDDVFVSVWENRATLEAIRSFQGYLFRSVRNRALNHVRDVAFRTAWQNAHADRPRDAAMGVGSRDIRDVMETEELAREMRAAINSLSESRRTVVTLRWIEEMSYAEIATVLGTTVIGVKQQLNRSLRDLRNILSPKLRDD